MYSHFYGQWQRRGIIHRKQIRLKRKRKLVFFMMYDYRMEEIMKKRCIKYFRKKGKNGGYQFDEKKIAKKETIENIL